MVDRTLSRSGTVSLAGTSSWPAAGAFTVPRHGRGGQGDLAVELDVFEAVGGYVLAADPEDQAYAANRATGLICLHFASTYDGNTTRPQSESPPALLAIRHDDGAYMETFTFTPTGTAYR
ncbi:hypothetical protein GA0070607_0086 [Micromonospora coriariae]|uniref:Uncharacterized protein n=1 Tax=Micromonospora coriariae TaxID=285665 RepID=A0A1C4U399_9ACTN|nr:hypothetical protein [Micromonospora coriariae]SCE66160.1 hypothetical protein GA0070607_0086 [Micromonospora coriariae]